MRFFSRNLLIVGLACCIAGLAVSACSLMPQAVALDGAEREQAIASAAPLADNLFGAMLAKDYAAFSKDFDEAMKKAMNETSFEDMVETFDAQIGSYQSHEVETVEQIENLVVVTYRGRFEKEENVSIRLTIRMATQPQVAGLWFDSPKLREK